MQGQISMELRVARSYTHSPDSGFHGDNDPRSNFQQIDFHFYPLHHDFFLNAKIIGRKTFAESVFAELIPLFNFKCTFPGFYSYSPPPFVRF